MQSTAVTPEQYFDELPAERKEAMLKLREVIKANLPEGFEEVVAYGMIGYVVPYTLYPKGYHCKPKQPLPFINLASQKNFIALYHMGLYANPKLHEWFTSEYPNYSKAKLDMGKACIRFKKPEHIPYDLLAQLLAKMTPQDWITIYESYLK